jgi:hypothetical protein
MRLTVVASLLLAHAVSAQTLQSHPVVAIGGAAANTNDELVKVTGARRLPDGHIVVAIGNPIELRVYDRSGKLISRIGRKGSGPGEFRTAVAIPYADNDSIVTFTVNYNRFEVFQPSGKLIHEYEQKTAPWPPPLLHRALLRSPGGIVNGCARAVMMALPLVTPANLYEVIPDGSGHLWAHAMQSREWRVYSLAGPFLGTVTLPPGATVLDLGADYMLAHMRDADDFEQVVEFRVSVPAGAIAPLCAAKRDSFPFASTNIARVTQLKQVLRDAMAANEVFFGDAARYPKTADSLRMKLPGGTGVRVIEASGRGYATAVLDTQSTLVCVIRVADGSFNWPDGITFCGN